MRSLLMIDAVDRAALAASLTSAADAVVVDVADIAAVAGVLDWLVAVQASARRPLGFIRLPSIRMPDADAILDAILAGEPDGILLGQCHDGADVQHLGAKLAVGEAVHDLPEGGVSIIAEAGTSARALFSLATFIDASERLLGLVGSPQALADSLGIDPSISSPGSTLATARTLTMVAARAAGVAAIDGAGPSHDLAAFRAACEAARRDGFNAKLATSDAEVAMVNAVFDPETA